MVTREEAPKPRGRAAQKLRTGLFIKEWLERVGEDSITGMHGAYISQMWLRVNQFRPKRERVRMCTYENFVKYFSHLRRLGLVEFVREEPTEYVAHDKLVSIRMLAPWTDSRPLPPMEVVQSTRRIYRLSDMGRSPAWAFAWEDPLLRRAMREALLG